MSNNKTSPKVLLTNDDGPDSPFFTPWMDYVRNNLKWENCVCIPDTNKSFISKAMTQESFKISKNGDDMYLVPAPPATCVNLALYHLCSDTDLVISGPNIGHNAGRNFIASSGTVGAAIEGALQGRRAVAFSFPFTKGWNNWTSQEISDAISKSAELISKLWQDWDTTQADWYNMNIPLGFQNGVDAKITTVDQEVGYSSLYDYSEERGEYFWQPQGLKVFQHPSPQNGGDVESVKQGVVSITPMKLNGYEV